MSKKLTKQDKKFIEVVTETGNQTLAAKQAYGIKDDGYARLKGHRLITKANIQESIKSIADSIPDELLVEKHLALLNKRDNLFVDQIDSSAVKAGLDMGYKLKGSYAPEKRSIEIDEELLEAVRGRVGNILE